MESLGPISDIEWFENPKPIKGYILFNTNGTLVPVYDEEGTIIGVVNIEDAVQVRDELITQEPWLADVEEQEVWPIEVEIDEDAAWSEWDFKETAERAKAIAKEHDG